MKDTFIIDMSAIGTTTLREIYVSLCKEYNANKSGVDRFARLATINSKSGMEKLEAYFKDLNISLK